MGSFDGYANLTGSAEAVHLDHRRSGGESNPLLTPADVGRAHWDHVVVLEQQPLDSHRRCRFFRGADGQGRQGGDGRIFDHLWMGECWAAALTIIR